jgi:hypothetical protein
VQSSGELLHARSAAHSEMTASVRRHARGCIKSEERVSTDKKARCMQCYGVDCTKRFGNSGNLIKEVNTRTRCELSEGFA